MDEQWHEHLEEVRELAKKLKLGVSDDDEYRGPEGEVEITKGGKPIGSIEWDGYGDYWVAQQGDWFKQTGTAEKALSLLLDRYKTHGDEELKRTKRRLDIHVELEFDKDVSRPLQEEAVGKLYKFLADMLVANRESLTGVAVKGAKLKFVQVGWVKQGVRLELADGKPAKAKAVAKPKKKVVRNYGRVRAAYGGA